MFLCMYCMRTCMPISMCTHVYAYACMLMYVHAGMFHVFMF